MIISAVDSINFPGLYEVIAHYETLSPSGGGVVDGSNYDAKYLIKQNGNIFSAEDDTGNGIQRFEFSNSTLLFNYLVNGTVPQEGLSSNYYGSFVLEKQ